MKRLAGMFTLVLVAALAAPITAQDKPALPKAATEQAAPIPVAPQDVQAISQAVQTANAYALAIAALQEKLDSANAEAQRAFARAQAQHPDMPIDVQTMTYKPKK